jgi:hypothetical protein
MCSMSVHYIILSTNHQQMHKESLSLIVTHSYMFRPCWVVFRENFFVIVALRLHLIVELECAVDLYCVVFGGVNSPQSGHLQKQRSTQSTAHSHSTLKCNPSVTVTSSPWRRPSRVETCRNVLRLMIKLSLCMCWWLVFCIEHLVGF